MPIYTLSCILPCTCDALVALLKLLQDKSSAIFRDENHDFQYHQISFSWSLVAMRSEFTNIRTFKGFYPRSIFFPKLTKSWYHSSMNSSLFLIFSAFFLQPTYVKIFDAHFTTYGRYSSETHVEICSSCVSISARLSFRFWLVGIFLSISYLDEWLFHRPFRVFKSVFLHDI